MYITLYILTVLIDTAVIVTTPTSPGISAQNEKG